MFKKKIFLSINEIHVSSHVCKSLKKEEEEEDVLVAVPRVLEHSENKIHELKQDISSRPPLYNISLSMRSRFRK